MPVRLIGTIILLLAVTLFAGANLDNRCNINFIFKTVQNVPVFLTAVVSFLAGAIVMIPFTFHSRKNKKNGAEAKISKQKNQDEESKTLFDFKIKKDVSKSQKKEKRPLFKKSEKNAEEPKKSENENAAAEKSSDEKTGVSSENTDSSL
mgnify:CR=1 FL=1